MFARSVCHCVVTGLVVVALSSVAAADGGRRGRPYNDRKAAEPVAADDKVRHQESVRDELPANEGGTGACCLDDPFGDCIETTAVLCVGMGTFLGGACDPNCCQQPLTDGDNCEDLPLMPLSVPGSITISGDSSAAWACDGDDSQCDPDLGPSACGRCSISGANCDPGDAMACDNGVEGTCDDFGTCTAFRCEFGDAACDPTDLNACEGGANGQCEDWGGADSTEDFFLDGDPGWWGVAFETTECADVTIDHCCSDPRVSPVYVFYFTECPGQNIYQTDEHNFGGSPDPGDCDSNGNLQAIFRALPAGQYYFPMYQAEYSDPTADIGPFQIHVTASECPPGACCRPDGSCVEETQGDCSAAGGEFQGDLTLCADVGGDCVVNDCDEATDVGCDSVWASDNSAESDIPNPIPPCWGGNDSVGELWFSFEATDAAVEINTCEGPIEIDTQLALYEGCGTDTLTLLACDEDGTVANGCEPNGPGFGAALCYEGLTPTNTYYIQISAFDAASQGAFQLDVKCMSDCVDPDPCEVDTDCCPDGICDSCDAYYCLVSGPSGSTCGGSPDCECTVKPRIFGDAGGNGGSCHVNASVNFHDAGHVWNSFQSQNVCDPIDGRMENADVGGNGGLCPKSGSVNLHDANHVWNVFQGINPCSVCPEDGPAPVSSEWTPPGYTEAASLSVVRHQRRVRPGDAIEVDVVIDQPLEGLQGYELHMEASGGARGQLTLIDIEIQDCADYVFIDEGIAQSGFNVGERKMAAGLPSAGLVGVPTEARGYLATFTYEVSPDALGTFVIDIEDWAARDAYAQKSFLTSSGLGMVEITSTTPAVVVVARGRASGLR